MSSKFFTWTKGDRRNAEALRSSGIVPIPAECISIKGMDYGRTEKGSSKAHNKPTPLSLDGSPEPTPKHSSRTTDSIALHDAAVQSATSLMGVINDMLRSPPLSAHLFAQNNRPDSLQPINSRPRSRTVPSTPLVEAPASLPVELPGSIPREKKPYLSVDGKVSGYVQLRHLTNAAIGASITRPHSNPREATHNIPDCPGASTPRVSPKSNLQPPLHSSPRSRSASPLPSVAMSPSNDSHEHTLVRHGSSNITLVTERPTLSSLPYELSTTSSLPTSTQTSRAGSTNTVPQLKAFQSRQQADPEAILMDQITNLRASHEAHVNSLKEAHEKDIASHRSYISFLEGRSRPAFASTTEGKQNLTIDTSHSAVRPGDLLNSDVSATTLQSFELSLDHQKRASQDPSDSVDALKRKLSLSRKAQADAVEIRRERDQLQEAVERNTRRISQLKDIVRKAKENEKALKNAAADLEARLVNANNERTDVLEGYHEACDKVHALAERESVLCQQLEVLRKQTSQASLTAADEEAVHLLESVDSVRPKHHRALSDVGELSRKNDTSVRQLQELRRLITNKDSHIRRLEEVVSAESKDERPAESIAHSVKIIELEEALAKHKQLLATAQSDAQRYNSLLHHELRRQSRSTAQKVLPMIPNIEAEASVVAREKLLRLKTQTETSTSSHSEGAAAAEEQSEPSTAVLEKELEHCIKEIIMYKFYEKEYRRDLRICHAKIDSLQALQRPPTPDGESAASSQSNCSPQVPRRHPSRSPLCNVETSSTSRSGLGIFVSESTGTPPKRMRSATSGALQFPTPPSRASNVSSPPPISKTPLSIDKALPTPPASRRFLPLPVTPPPPSVKLQRNATLRSLSESIISSYTKRGSPEQNLMITPTSRDRSSAPLQSIGSPMMPLSRFATTQPIPTGQAMHHA